MIISTQDKIEGYEITETLGLVKANAVKCRHIGMDILATFRNIIGGDIPEYSKLITESREQVLEQMKLKAKDWGANGVVAVRFSTSAVMQNAAELFVYGTAVKIQKIQEANNE